MTPLELATELNEIYSSIKEGLDKTPLGLIGELETRGVYLARSAEILADAQIILDKKRGEVSEQFVGNKESWNILKSIIESRCQDEKKLYVLAERLNSTLTHQLDEIRTILSYEKESLRNIR